jgi:hypothetical protein
VANDSARKYVMFKFKRWGERTREPLLLPTRDKEEIILIKPMTEYELTRQILALSNARTWDEAKLEWALENVYMANEPETCLCGHFPIVELCVLKNKRNGKQATVGNCCVKKFIGLPSDKIFQAVKRVRGKIESALNAEAVEHAYKRSWISEWEKFFYLDTLRKRKLSARQQAKRIEINRKILTLITFNPQKKY